MLCKCAGGVIMLCFRFRRRPLLHSSTHYFRRMNRSSVAGPRLCFGTAAQLARAGASPRPPYRWRLPKRRGRRGPAHPQRVAFSPQDGRHARIIADTRAPAQVARRNFCWRGRAAALSSCPRAGASTAAGREHYRWGAAGAGGHAARRASRASHAWRLSPVCLPAGCTTRSRASSWPTTGWNVTP